MSDHLEAIRRARTKRVRADGDLHGAVKLADSARLAGEPITKEEIADAAGVSRPTLDAMLRKGKAA